MINFSSFWSSLFCYFQFDFRISISTASPHRKNKLSNVCVQLLMNKYIKVCKTTSCDKLTVNCTCIRCYHTYYVVPHFICLGIRMSHRPIQFLYNHHHNFDARTIWHVCLGIPFYNWSDLESNVVHIFQHHWHICLDKGGTTQGCKGCIHNLRWNMWGRANNLPVHGWFAECHSWIVSLWRFQSVQRGRYCCNCYWYQRQHASLVLLNKPRLFLWVHRLFCCTEERRVLWCCRGWKWCRKRAKVGPYVLENGKLYRGSYYSTSPRQCSVGCSSPLDFDFDNQNSRNSSGIKFTNLKDPRCLWTNVSFLYIKNKPNQRQGCSNNGRLFPTKLSYVCMRKDTCCL